jgi:hypothetical protein
MPSFSRDLEETLHRSVAYANQRRHEYVTPEHLLLSLIDDADAVQVFHDAEIDANELRRWIRQYIDNELNDLKWAEGDAKPTSRFQAAVQLAVIQLQAAQDNLRDVWPHDAGGIKGFADEVDGAQLLLAISYDYDSKAREFLKNVGLTTSNIAPLVAVNLAHVVGLEYKTRILEGFDEGYLKSQQFLLGKKKEDRRKGRPKTKIGKSVIRNNQEILLQSHAVHYVIDERIGLLRGQRPNSVSANLENLQQIEELEEIKRVISSLEATVSAFSQKRQGEDELVSIADEIHHVLIEYIRKNGQDAIHLTFKGALIGLLTVVGHLCGVAQITSTTMSVIVGGKVVVDGLKAVRGAHPRKT